MKTKTKYVLGLMFNTARTHMVCVKKTRGPSHLIGKLTAPGGHVEPSDSSLEAAVVREVEEETGVKTEEKKWGYVGQTIFEDSIMDVFVYVDDIVMEAKTMTEEPVIIIDRNNIDPYDAFRRPSVTVDNTNIPYDAELGWGRDVYVLSDNLITLMSAALEPRRPVILLDYTPYRRSVKP